VAVVDRENPGGFASEWHEDGTAGENDRASGVAAMAPAGAMDETRPGRDEPRWQALEARGRSVAEMAPMALARDRHRPRRRLT
jgi:hypothetical protein